jgi:hypothetical protein
MILRVTDKLLNRIGLQLIVKDYEQKKEKVGNLYYQHDYGPNNYQLYRDEQIDANKKNSTMYGQNKELLKRFPNTLKIAL